MFLSIHPDNPNPRNLQKAVACLKAGGIIIYPTDTIYGLGCDITNQKAVERICRIKNIKPEKSNFSFICSDLSHISAYAKNIETPVYKAMRKNLPGPFTFILEASNAVPKLFKNSKKTVGIRIPDNNICIQLVKELGNPIMSTSLHDDDAIIEYSTDPELIYEKYINLVDLVIDGGYGKNIPSTVVDCSQGEFNILRQGAGELEV